MVPSRPRSRSLLAFAVVTVCALSARAQDEGRPEEPPATVDQGRVVARVGQSEYILRSDVVQTLLIRRGKDQPGDAYVQALAQGDTARARQLERAQLQELIEQRCLVIEAKQRGIKLGEQDEQRVQAFLRRLFGGDSGVERARQQLAEAGVPWRFYLETKRVEYLIQVRLLPEAIDRKVFVSPEQLRDYYDRNKSRFQRRAKLEVQRLVVYHDPDLAIREHTPQVKRAIDTGWNPQAFAEELAARLAKGDDFETVALEGSMHDDWDKKTAYRDLDHFAENFPTPAIVDAVAKLDERTRWTKVIAVPNAKEPRTYEIYFVPKRVRPGMRPFDEVAGKIQRDLIKDERQRRQDAFRQKLIENTFWEVYEPQER